MPDIKIRELRKEAFSLIEKANNKGELEQLRITYLGRKGKINRAIKTLSELPIPKRSATGNQINQLKKEIESLLIESETILEKKQTDTKEWFDITLPGINPTLGHLHLVTQAIREITEIFERTGFIRVRYPEVEWDRYAFEHLNMPEIHPARDDFETFYLDPPPSEDWGKMLLTPHTSSGQIREMEYYQEKHLSPPIRMINIGKVYRPNYDISHTPMFHQFEGLLIDREINIAHLKGTFDYFAREFFGPERKTRLRPFHFRFTEPSFEVDITCGVCQGKGCRLCKEGWLELGGSGMVHPVVLKNGGLDPDIYSGYAFGWGVERVMMMKSGLKLPDLRLFYSTDLRILNQF
ncbi:MAG TPA: phenylalanine--tRNA ligase subunit alpha [Candidatus Bathyarchaeia archaeon]|nr:phenylalanine--tRNA ligase subunit alpha [Candidatus Bathyarchaeia archaeon]